MQSIGQRILLLPRQWLKNESLPTKRQVLREVALDDAAPAVEKDFHALAHARRELAAFGRINLGGRLPSRPSRNRTGFDPAHREAYQRIFGGELQRFLHSQAFDFDIFHSQAHLRGDFLMT